ncbi:MAG: isoprenylcysteine carboxylmethyltransferase family protein [Candidatus Omnitrophota bacterium]
MKILKVTIIIGMPLLVIALFLAGPAIKGKLLFSAFILLAVFERAWEGLCTSRDKDSDKIEGDWTLPISALSYIILVILCLAEFYSVPRIPNLIIASMGLCVYVSSIALRLWSINSLGDQWSIHIIGADKLNGQRRLVCKGPYRYIRHPVYLGIILEQISIPLAANLYYTAIIAACFAIPFQIIKARLEEGEMEKRLGAVYKEYISKTPRFNIFNMRHA